MWRASREPERGTVKGPHVGTVLSASVKPFMPIAGKPAVVAPMGDTLEAAGTRSGDD
jgi:hypothetical protein